MTNTSPPPAADPGPADHHDQPGRQGPRTSRNEVLELGRLRRSNDDRRIAGVAGGLARHLDIDPIIVRVALVVLVFFGGSGLLLYGAVWLLVPEEGSPAQPLGLDDRNRNIALMGTGVLAAIAAVGDFAGAFWFPWPLVILGLVVVWFLNRKEKDPRAYVPPTSGYGAASAGTPGTPGTPGATSAATEEPSWQTRTMPGTDAPAQPYQAPYQPYQGYQAQTWVKPRNPRKKGPILFWFTLALIATGVGTLGIIDVSGTAVPDAAYPALAMTLTGAMLLLGAFWGRAGGLIFIGLVAAAATLGATVTSNYDGTRLAYTPTSSAEVRTSYDIGGGELTLDLSQVDDVEGLDGRELSVDAGVGDIEVIVPDGMDISVDASTGIGEVSLFGEYDEGFDINRETFLDGGDEVPDMRISIDLGVGQVTVREQ